MGVRLEQVSLVDRGTIKKTFKTKQLKKQFEKAQEAIGVTLKPEKCALVFWLKYGQLHFGCSQESKVWPKPTSSAIQ